MLFPHLFMGFSAICFPICFPISVGLGKHGETNGKTFSRFCIILRDFAFQYHYSHHIKTSLFIGFPAILWRIPLFTPVELEGVEHKKWNTFVYWAFPAIV